MAIANDAELDARIETIIQNKFAHMLEDVTFRIGQAYDVAGRGIESAVTRGKVYAEDLNLPGKFLMTGYTTTPNSPVAGSFAWLDLHIVYKGQDNSVTNGNTANKYVWWSSTTTPTVLQSGPTKPVLADGDVLLFVNEAGTPRVMLSDTNASMPFVLSNNAVDTGAIAANAVTTVGLADDSVTSAQLANGSVLNAAMGANAITANKIADASISRTGQLTGKIIGAAVIVDNSITTLNLNDNAVTGTKLATGAVVRANQLGANVVTTSAILANNVTTAQIAANAVTSNEIAGNSVSAIKLNILRHILY